MTRTCLLGIFVVTLVAAILLNANGTTAQSPVSPQADENGALPAWVAQTGQQGYYLTWTAKRQALQQTLSSITEMNGEAFVPEDWYKVGSFPFFVTTTYEYDFEGFAPCDPMDPYPTWGVHQHQRILDPSRYSGRRNSTIHTNVVKENGHYIMPFPIPLDWTYTIETFNEGSNCTSGPYTSRETTQDSYIVSELFNKMEWGEGDLTCDDTASLCWLNFEETLYNYRTTWHIRAVRVGECAGHAAPIDALDPVIVDHKGRMQVTLDADQSVIAPSGSAVLQAKVTCDGVPVENASVLISSKAEPYSGGHNHENAKYPRPGGCLDGQKVNAKLPVITILTDNTGVARIMFQAGTNETCGTPRGIAGAYNLTAQYFDTATLEEEKAEREIIVGRVAGQEFSELPKNDSDYWICRDGTETHRSGSWGTSPTIARIKELAGYFGESQIIHFGGVIAELPVGDISLKDGGLFDVAAKKTTKWIPWKAPHYEHWNGTEVYFPNCWSKYLPATQRLWLNAKLRSWGKLYGIWLKNEPGMHLRFNQTQVPTRNGAAADAPDLTVTALADRSPDLPTAAPGQVVLFAFSADNMNSGVAANRVILTATLPLSLTILEVSPPADRTVAPGSLAWDAGTLAGPEVLELFTVTTRVNADVVPGAVLTATAEATTADAESVPENNSDAFGLIIQPPGPDLVIGSDIDSAAMVVGEPITFTMSVANYGNAPAQNTALTLTLPPSVTLRHADPVTATADANVVTWQLGEVAPDDERIITATVELDFSLIPATSPDPETDAGGWLTYTLVAGNTAGDIDLDNNSEEVIKPVELAGSDVMVWLGVEGDEEVGTLTAGQNLTYTLYYANYGNQIAPTTTITLSLGSGLSLISAQPAPDSTGADPDFAGGIYGWQLGDIAIGAENAIPVQIHVGTVPVTGTVALAAITTDAMDIQPENNTVYDFRTAVKAPAPYSSYLPLVLK